MKNDVYTYNSELGDAFMNLYKKIHKIEKKTTTEEKIRIYTGITAVMPDELLEIKRVIDKMQDHTINMLDLGFNNETPMSSNYMMNVNAAENAINDMNAVVELFNFIREKNNLPTDVDIPIPMSIIGELKSAFENHDFKLFEKIATSNEYELGKMFAPPFISPFDDLIKPDDTPATVEQLDDVFDDALPEPTNEPSESNEDVDVHELNDSVKESNIESFEESKDVLDPAVVMAYPTDMSVMINLIDELIAGFNTQSDDFINVLSKVNNKYKSNVTFGAAYIMMHQYYDNLNLTIDPSITMDTVYNICSEVFKLDSLNFYGNTDDSVPIESLSISDEVIGYICKQLLNVSHYNTKYMIVRLVKNEFGIDINIWEVAAISYVLINMLGGKYTINEGNALHPLMKNYRSLFNIPKSEVESSTVKSKSRRRKKKEVEDNLQAK